MGIKTNANYYTLAWGLVHNRFHKMGFGKLLLQYRLMEFKKLYPNQQLFLDTTQHSYTFFEKFGFTITKITNNFYEKNLHRYDMVLE